VKDYKILISGYYGFSNIGDEAILLSISESLYRINPNLRLCVISANPKATSREHNLLAIARLDLKAIWKQLRECDLLISGGGSLFQDVTSSRSLFLYLGVIFLAIFRGVPVMIYSQGIGPLRRKFNRWLTAVMLRRVKLITVRDNSSLAELIRLGVPNHNTYLSADPVMPLASGEVIKGKRLINELIHSEADLDSSPLIGVSIRPWMGEKHLLDELTLLLKRLIDEKKAKVFLIAMHYPGDDNLTEQLYTKLASPESVYIVPKEYAVREMIDFMAALNLVIGVRLHALVFAALAATPAIAISYDPKVDHFAVRMRQTSAGSISDVTADLLWEDCLRLLQNEDEIRARTLALADDLRHEARKSAELAMTLLHSRGLQSPH
jgi:polysaccharide pyruvyl transferase CsaB